MTALTQKLHERLAWHAKGRNELIEALVKVVEAADNLKNRTPFNRADLLQDLDRSVFALKELLK